MGSSATLALLRGADDAALLSLVGVLVFIAALAPAEPASLRARLRRLAFGSALAGFLLGLAWLLAETAEIADVEGLGGAVGALPSVMAAMSFGQLLVLRLLLLAVAAGLLSRRRGRAGLALAVAMVALGIQPWLGHAGAAAGRLRGVLIGSELLHLFAAAAWLGGLAPLAICLAVMPSGTAASVFRRFSWLGLVAVVLIAATAAVQGWLLAGGAAGLVGTDYGKVAMLKAFLFLAALAFAAANGLGMTGALTGSDPGAAVRNMHLSLVLESLTGLAVVLAAGWLAGMAPGFAQRPVPVEWRLLLAGLLLPLFAASAAVMLLRGSGAVLNSPRNRR